MTDEQSRIPAGRVARVAPLIGLAGLTAGEAVAASLRKRRHGGDLTDFHARQAERYVQRLGRSRGVLMKAGQVLSFIPPDPTSDVPHRGIYQAAFARLQDDAPPMPAETAIAVLSAELGRPPGEVFAEFDPRSFAAASIGQVHSATLPDGRRVAVKVQYPGVERAIRADLANAELLATFFQVALTLMPGLPRMDVRAMAQEVSERIGEEVDYRIEAINQGEFANTYRDHPFIRIPEVIPQFSTRRVLITEYCDGIRYAEAVAAEQSLRDAWGEAIFRFQWGNLLQRGVCNADPHPGNYLFHDDGSVTFLDFGCVKRFSKAEVECLAEFSNALISGDPGRLLNAATAMGMFDATDPPAASELLAMFTATLQCYVGPQPFTYTPEYFAQVVRHSTLPVSRAVLRKLTGRGMGSYTFTSRIENGVAAVLSGLRATGNWRAIREEYASGSAPATAYGELDAAHRKAGR